LDEPQLAEVERAMHHLAQAWAGRDAVPKRLAMALVDIQSGFDNRFYDEAEQERLEEAGMRLVELAYELLDDEREPTG
jgi:hypothetical protein